MIYRGSVKYLAFVCSRASCWEKAEALRENVRLVVDYGPKLEIRLPSTATIGEVDE